jgi:hypothetical protein
MRANTIALGCPNQLKKPRRNAGFFFALMSEIIRKVCYDYPTSQGAREKEGK